MAQEGGKCLSTLVCLFGIFKNRQAENFDAYNPATAAKIVTGLSNWSEPASVYDLLIIHLKSFDVKRYHYGCTLAGARSNEPIVIVAG